MQIIERSKTCPLVALTSWRYPTPLSFQLISSNWIYHTLLAHCFNRFYSVQRIHQHRVCPPSQILSDSTLVLFRQSSEVLLFLEAQNTHHNNEFAHCRFPLRAQSQRRGGVSIIANIFNVYSLKALISFCFLQGRSYFFIFTVFSIYGVLFCIDPRYITPRLGSANPAAKTSRDKIQYYVFDYGFESVCVNALSFLKSFIILTCDSCDCAIFRAFEWFSGSIANTDRRPPFSNHNLFGAGQTSQRLYYNML